jgi:hypothetical protein
MWNPGEIMIINKLDKVRIVYYVLSIYAFFLTIVGAQQQDVPEPLFINFSIQAPYVPMFHGRDPFKSLNNITRSSQVTLSELEYHGVIHLGDFSMALFTWRGNPGVRYTLKNRTLFDGNGKLIDGVVGDISDTKVVVSQGDQKIVYPR